MTPCIAKVVMFFFSQDCSKDIRSDLCSKYVCKSCDEVCTCGVCGKTVCKDPDRCGDLRMCYIYIHSCYDVDICGKCQAKPEIPDSKVVVHGELCEATYCRACST